MASRSAEVAELPSVASVAEEELVLPVKRSWAAILLATAEAVCVFVVSSAKLGLVMASAAAAGSSWVALWHRDIFRIPVLVLACLCAITNLLVTRRALLLRRAPSAAWRQRAFTRRERLRMATVVILSVASLLIAGAEAWIHDVQPRLGL